MNSKQLGYGASFLAVLLVLCTGYHMLNSHGTVEMEGNSDQQFLEMACSHDYSVKVRLDAVLGLKDNSLRLSAWSYCLKEESNGNERLFFIQNSGIHKEALAVPILDDIVGSPEERPSTRILAAESLSMISQTSKSPGLTSAALAKNGHLRLAVAEALIRTGSVELGFNMLFRALQSNSYCQLAAQRLVKIIGPEFSFDPMSGPVKRHVLIKTWRRWVKTHFKKAHSSQQTISIQSENEIDTDSNSRAADPRVALILDKNNKLNQRLAVLKELEYQQSPYLVPTISKLTQSTHSETLQIAAIQILVRMSSNRHRGASVVLEKLQKNRRYSTLIRLLEERANSEKKS